LNSGARKDGSLALIYSSIIMVGQEQFRVAILSRISNFVWKTTARIAVTSSFTQKLAWIHGGLIMLIPMLVEVFQQVSS
jgi:hypothetical protein